MSRPMAGPQPMRAENATASRPAIQASTSTRSGPPRTGRRPVQLGMAVSRKPPMAATWKPKTISWMCQSTGEKAVGTSTCPVMTAIQTRRVTPACSGAKRKNGRKP